MNFNKHFNLEGKHALLGASKYHWINDDENGLIKRIKSNYASDLGTALHEIAYKRIKYRFKLTKHDKRSVMLDLLDKGIPGIVLENVDFETVFNNLQNYVNDSIGFRMTPEVVLFFSENAFGTTDAISFDKKSNLLRIHDYKSGYITAHMEQLLIYTALFCLEYNIKPSDLETELRIYQSNEILYHNPKTNDIVPIIDKIITFDKIINRIKEQEN